jgi:hypothetical protein
VPIALRVERRLEPGANRDVAGSDDAVAAAACTVGAFGAQASLPDRATLAAMVRRTG